MCKSKITDKRTVAILLFFLSGFVMMFIASTIDEEDSRLAVGCIAICLTLLGLLISLRCLIMPKNGYTGRSLIALNVLDIYLCVMIGCAVILSIFALFDMMNVVAGFVFVAFGYPLPLIGYIVLGTIHIWNNNKDKE